MAGRLVVPLDGSALSEAALPWAALLARRQGLKLVLAQIVPWPVYLGMDGGGGFISGEVFDQIVSAEKDAADEYLRDVQDRLQADGLSVETVVREGTPADRVLDLADEIGAYAVVMSSHGRGGLTRLLLGSIAERILTQATVPVLLVRAHDERAAAPSLDRVLVPVDGSPLAERALDLALGLIGNGTLVLTRVIAPVEVSVTGDEVVSVVDQQATARVVAAGQQYLADLTRSRQLAPDRVQARVRIGDAAEQILQGAREDQADLIVMSTHGRTGPGRWLLGSVADQVARRADQPVFIVSARTAAAQVVGPFSVRDVMTRDLESLAEDEPLIIAIRKLLRRRVSGAPVLDRSGTLVGVISEHDFLAWQARQIDALARGATLDPRVYAQRLEDQVVGDIMSSPAVSIAESASLGEALRMLLERQLHRLPVTRDGQLVGILSRSDVLRAMASQWELTGGKPAPAGNADARTQPD